MNEVQRIAFVCHPYHRGGVTRWMADAAIAFAEKRMDVYFVTVEPVTEFHSAKGRETLLHLLSREPNIVRILKAKAGHEFEFGTAEYRAYIYRKLLVQLPIGTPVILSDDAVVWAATASLYTSYPIIGVLHADEEQYYELAEKYYKQASSLVCVSSRVNKTAHERAPQFDAGHIYTIPCGINLPPVAENSKSNNVLQLAYVGRLSDYQKRTGDLVDICALLAKNNTPFHLRIIGDGEAKVLLENRFRAEGLDHCVTFYGWLSQDQVGIYLSESDVLILTSDFEGMPIAMMEALATGCGVAGTRVSGIEDYEHHPLAADCLSVFTVGAIEDAVNKINMVAAVPKERRRWAARKLAESEFSMEVCLGKYLEVIEAIQVTPISAGGEIRLSPLKLLYSNLLSLVRKMKVGMK